MKIKQGTILPTTGIGTGYLFLLAYLALGWHFGLKEFVKMPLYYLLILIPALMQFSYKDFIIKENDAGHYHYRYRILFIISFTKRFSFADYKTIVIRVMNKTYRVKQAARLGLVVNEGTHNEKYLALVGYSKNGEKTEICKGKKDELDAILKNQVLPLGIPVYMGAPKKGYEYNPA